MPALKYVPGTIAGEDEHPQMSQVLGNHPGAFLQENIETDERGLAAQLLYLELVQEVHPDCKSFPEGSAFELSVADEVLAARHAAVCHLVLATSTGGAPARYACSHSHVLVIGAQIAACKRYMSALEAAEECDYPEFGFPLPLETTPISEPHMPQEALDRWGFVIVACCTPSHRDLAERLRKSCCKFGIYRRSGSEIRRRMRKD
jgi:hypothetical protein